MFKFENGALRIQKVDVPKLDVNIMSDLQQSYRNYIEKTIYNDMRFLEETIRGAQNCENYSLSVQVKPIEKQTFGKTQVAQGKYYYPVIGTFSIDGSPVGRDMEILRIPYMDDYGKINVDGNSKVVLTVLRSSEDVSYTLKTNTMNISMPYANVRIEINRRGVRVRYGNQKIALDRLIAAMLAELNDDTNLCDIFTSTHLVNIMKVQARTLNRYAYAALTSQSDILTKYKSEQYRLGKTRDALNEVLSLDKAIGYTLARDVEGTPYKEGELVTQAMVSGLKKARINVIYVYSHTSLQGYTLAMQAPYFITDIPAGTRNCAILRQKLPQFAMEAYIPDDTKLAMEDAIVLSNDEPLTADLADFILVMKIPEVMVYPGASKKAIKYSFEREVVGNCTARLRELTDDIPDDRSADEWVYYYHNPNLQRTDTTDWLTPHDLMAIMSLMGDIFTTGNTSLLNRDNSFLKKAMMVNEIFSETLRATITQFFQSYKASIIRSISEATASNPFYNLTKQWIKTMNDRRYLSAVDSTNVAAEVSQVCHVTNLMSTDAEVVDEMRYLAMPYYGRLCPFETPAGKKLGLVNTKAIGARVRDGLMLAPYRKVIGTANGIRISNQITWLSVKDELGHKFGDLLSLKSDPKNPGNYLNTPILARIPNPDISDEPFIFTTIDAFELAGGYVDACPEQFLSPTAALVPFVCSDNAIRISYGVSQIRQAVYLLKSQKGRVRTDMSEDIFSYSDTDKYYAPCTGEVVAINNISASIKDYSGDTRVVYMQGSGHQGQLDATVSLKVKVGDTVQEGTVIAEAHKYPQPFVVRAPFSGRIISISDTAIEIDKSASSKGSFVNLENVDMVAISNGRIMGQSAVFLNLHVSVGDYVTEGQILADTCMSRDGVYSPARCPLVAYVSTAYNYEDGVHAFESASVDYTSIIAHSMEHKVSKRHNPYSRADVISGFRYCGIGDTIGTIRLNERIDSSNTVRHTVKATQKVNGIPYEVRTIEDTPVSKTYKYHLLGFNKLQAGDKMAGMHGNKGVVSIVSKDSQAFQLKNGKTIQFALNPCGVPSRMNLGQIWDAHLGLVATVLGIEIKTNSYNCAPPEDVKYLMKYAHTLANTIAIGDNAMGTYNRNVFDIIAKAFDQIPPEIHEIVWSNIANVIDWRDTFDENGDAMLYDPVTETWLEYKVTIGCPTYLKLMQEADEKLNVRAGVLEEQYARTTSQPQKGEGSAKGQRMAEMELMALASAGTAAVIDEVLNEKSDNTGRMVENTLHQLGLDGYLPESCKHARSVENLLYMLEALGVDCVVPKSIASTSWSDSRSKYTYDIPKLVNQAYHNTTGESPAKVASEMVTDYDKIED